MPPNEKTDYYLDPIPRSQRIRLAPPPTDTQIAQFRRDLPDVQVRHQGRVYTSRVVGRLNDQATVALDTPGNLPLTYSFAWATLTRAYLADVPIQTGY